MKLSVCRSTLAVASSSTRIFVRRSMALAKHKSCFWPAENSVELSVTPVISCSFIFLIVSSSCTSRKLSQIFSSVSLLKGSRFSRIVPCIKNGDCGMKAMLCRSKCKPISRISTPSILTYPSLMSTRRNKTCKMELLPEPVRPTIPIFIPGCTVKLRSQMLGSSIGR